MFSSSPTGIASQMTGLPTGKPKHARGKKGSGKPFAAHVGAIQKAHGAGDLAAVKTHALNLANAVHKHLQGQSLAGLPEMPKDENETQGTAPDEQDPSTPNALSAAPAKNNRTMLAMLAMSRRK